MTLRIKVRQIKRLMARNKSTSEDMLVIIKGGVPGNEPTPEDIERARAEVRAINAAGRGTGRVHVIGGIAMLSATRGLCPRTDRLRGYEGSSIGDFLATRRC